MGGRETVELKIEELALGGAGVARGDDGRVVFVHGGAPGDRVRAHLTRRRASFAEAEIVEVLEASSQRRERPCALAESCGGCPWQHIGDEAQNAAKTALLRNALRRVAPERDALVFAAPAPLAYRRRARFTWRSQAGELTLGFARWRSRELIDVQRCPVLVPPLQAALERLRAHLAAWAGDGRGSALLLAGPEGVHLSLRVDAGQTPPPGPALEPIVGGLIWREQRVISRWGQEAIALDERSLRTSGGAFTQANAAQDGQLRQWVSEWTAARSGPILELYCGVGNLSTALAAPGRALTAVESSPEALRWLRQNIEEMRGSVEVIEGDAAGVTAALAARGASYEGVVLDPPREGAKEVMASLLGLGPAWIVYVSCDPMTLARDLDTLVAGGYGIEALRGLDMMPQSTHIEAAVLLVRLDNAQGAG